MTVIQTTLNKLFFALQVKNEQWRDQEGDPGDGREGRASQRHAGAGKVQHLMNDHVYTVCSSIAALRIMTVWKGKNGFDWLEMKIDILLFKKGLQRCLMYFCVISIWPVQSDAI